jgi:hypothetical protein
LRGAGAAPAPPAQEEEEEEGYARLALPLSEVYAVAFADTPEASIYSFDLFAQDVSRDDVHLSKPGFMTLPELLAFIRELQ